MKSVYDPDADALYLRFSDKPIIESNEIADGVIFDFDSEGRIVAIEFLAAKRRLTKGAV